MYEHLIQPVGAARAVWDRVGCCVRVVVLGGGGKGRGEGKGGRGKGSVLLGGVSAFV